MTLKREKLEKQIDGEFEQRRIGVQEDPGEEPEIMKVLQIRMSPRDISILRRHFKEEGLGLSAGARRVLSKYMQEKRLK